jgi:hypothetical protein
MRKSCQRKPFKVKLDNWKSFIKTAKLHSIVVNLTIMTSTKEKKNERCTFILVHDTYFKRKEELHNVLSKPSEMKLKR